MSGKLLRSFAVLVCVLSISMTAFADVTGTWDISGIAKQRISIKGHSSGEESAVTDQFVFRPDRTFNMIDLPPEANGTWGYVKKKFAVYLDNGYLATNITNILIEGLQSEGYTVDIQNPAITKNTFTGKEMKDGTIKGKWNLIYAAYLYVTDFGRGFNMKYKSTITFTGTQVTGVDILGFDSNQSEGLFCKSIQSIITEAVCKGIQEALVAIEPMQ
jgi:hypothetical protein